MSNYLGAYGALIMDTNLAIDVSRPSSCCHQCADERIIDLAKFLEDSLRKEYAGSFPGRPGSAIVMDLRPAPRSPYVLFIR